MKPCSRAALALIAALFLPAHAGAEDLLDSYYRALGEDPALAAARASRSALREPAEQARALLRPSVGLSAGVAGNRQETTTPTFRDRNLYSSAAWGIQAGLPIFRRQLDAQVAVGEAIAEEAGHRLDGAKQDLMLRVARAYLGATTADEILDNTRAEFRTVERLRDITRRMADAGAATRIDVETAEAALDTARAAVIQTEQQRAAQREILATLTARSPDTLARLNVAIPPPTLEPGDAEAWAARTLDAPTMKALDETLRAARANVERARAGDLPTIDLQAQWNYTTQEHSNLRVPMNSGQGFIGFGLSWPIYQGGLVDSQVREAMAREDEASARRSEIERTLREQVRQVVLLAHAQQAGAHAMERATRSSQNALEATIQGFERGLRNATDVFTAQRARYRNEGDLVRLRYGYLESWLVLHAVAGRMSEDRLADVNHLLK